MKSTFKTLLDSIKLFVLFIGCTVLFYYGLQWLDHHYASTRKYDQPSDGAIKVVGQVQTSSTSDTVTNRFFQFLRDGE